MIDENFAWSKQTLRPYSHIEQSFKILLIADTDRSESTFKLQNLLEKFLQQKIVDFFKKALDLSSLKNKTQHFQNNPKPYKKLQIFFHFSIQSQSHP